MLQTLDRLRDGLPVGQRAAQPAVVHVELRATLGCFGDRFLRLTLGADEQDAPALGDGVAHDLQRLIQQRNGLRQVENVDAVAVTVDVLAHLGVPARGLVAVVNASFQQLTHGELRKSHALSFSGLNLDEAVFTPGWGQPADRTGFLPVTDQASPVKWRAYRGFSGGVQ
jgi:hypothetical protein